MANGLSKATVNDQRPVILLLGAKSTEQPLTLVSKELTDLKEVFRHYAADNHRLFRLDYDEDLTQSELKSYLDKLAGKLSILHFAGHSDGEVLQTDDLQVYAERIADIIKVWPSPPDLIFLNGCHNDGQVEVFHAAGVPVVIATSEKVNDAVAAEFAGEFYKSLLGSDEASLHAAFTVAKQKMQLSSPNQQLPTFSTSEPQAPSSSDDSDRSPNLSTIHTRADQLLLPWLLYAQIPEQESWTLRQILTQKRPVLGEDRQPINPYKGLEAFTESDSGFFFGRETLIDELAQNIADSPLVTLLGASGSGKSSLINAGVLPKLDREEWRIISVKPGNDPFAGLSSALGEAQLINDVFFDDFQAELRQEKGVLRFFTEHLASNPPQQKILLFIDQFEELFTQSERDVVEAFQQQLYELAEADLVNCHIVLVMRADFFSDVLENAKKFAQLLNRNLELLGIMDESELRAAINSPAEKQRVMIEPALLETLLSAVEDQPGSLPLLQDILHQLWGKRESPYLITLNEYNQLGGLKKALENRADNFLMALSEESQHVVQEIFLRLIKTGAGTEDTKRRAYLREFEGNATAKGIIQQLTNERLVLTEQSGGEDGYVEITHEALIKNWGSLRKWVDSDRDNIRVRNLLTTAAQNWEDHHKENNKNDGSWLMAGARLVSVEELFARGASQANPLEEKFFKASVAEREKKKRRTYSVVSGVIVTLSLVAAVAVWQWIQAGQERDRAFSQINTANKLIGNIQGDLRDKLQVINRLDIMSDVQKAVDEYHSDSRNIIQGTTDNLLIQSRRQRVRNQVDGADVLFSEGNTDKALEVYQSALTETINISSSVPNDSKWKSNTGIINLKIAQIYIQRKEIKPAYNHSQEALNLLNELLRAEPDNLLFRRDLVSAYQSLGTVHKSASMYVQALEYYAAGLQEINYLASLEKENIDYIEVKVLLLSGISSVYEKVDGIQKATKLLEANFNEFSEEQKKAFREAKSKVVFPCSEDCLSLAMDGHLKALSEMEGLVENHPENNLFYQKVVLMYQNVADTYQSMNDAENANKYHQLFIKHSSELLRRNPGHAEHNLLIAEGHFSKGNQHRVNNEFDLAKNQYAEGLSIIERLLSDDPNNETLQRIHQGQSVIYNGLDASKQFHELMKENGMAN